MFSRKEAISVIDNQIKKQNNANVEKYQEILKKINSMSDEEFENIAKQRIGENATIEMLSTWLKAKMEEHPKNEFTTIFAVSDLLKLKLLQKNFKDLGFQIEKGNKNFEKMFKNPYQATLSKKFLLSDEWRELKEKFVEGKPTIEEIESKEQLDK